MREKKINVTVLLCIILSDPSEKGKLFKLHSKRFEHKLCCLNGMNVDSFCTGLSSIQNMLDSEDTHIPYIKYRQKSNVRRDGKKTEYRSACNVRSRRTTK